MSYIHPLWAQRAAQRDFEETGDTAKLRILAEWSLTCEDVAEACGVSARAVRFWYVKGVRGVKLAVKRFDTLRTRSRAVTSPTAVDEFCTATGRPLPDWNMLPSHLQQKLQVGAYAPEPKAVLE